MPTVSIPLDTDEEFAALTADLTPAPSKPEPVLLPWQSTVLKQATGVTPEQIAKAFDVPADLIGKPIEYKPIDYSKTIADTSGFQKLVKMLVQDASNPTCDPTIVSAELLAGLGLDDPEQRRRTAWLFHQADMLLARDGWCQNTLHQAYEEMRLPVPPVKWGQQGAIDLQPIRETKYKHCTLGAFAMAVTGRLTERFEPNSREEAEFNRMQLFLSHSLGGTPVPAWNDHPSREAHHVHTALQTCQRYLLSV